MYMVENSSHQFCLKRIHPSKGYETHVRHWLLLDTSFVVSVHDKTVHDKTPHDNYHSKSPVDKKPAVSMSMQTNNSKLYRLDG